MRPADFSALLSNNGNGLPLSTPTDLADKADQIQLVMNPLLADVFARSNAIELFSGSNACARSRNS